MSDYGELLIANGLCHKKHIGPPPAHICRIKEREAYRLDAAPPLRAPHRRLLAWLRGALRR